MHDITNRHITRRNIHINVPLVHLRSSPSSYLGDRPSSGLPTSKDMFRQVPWVDRTGNWTILPRAQPLNMLN